jgi:hypothetical protein
VQDIVDPVTDEMLAKFVVNSHRKSHPGFDPLEEASLLPEVEADDEVRHQPGTAGNGSFLEKGTSLPLCRLYCSSLIDVPLLNTNDVPEFVSGLVGTPCLRHWLIGLCLLLATSCFFMC